MPAAFLLLPLVAWFELKLELELLNAIPDGTESSFCGVKWARVPGAYLGRRERRCGRAQLAVAINFITCQVLT
jgi:hypothetical protein